MAAISDAPSAPAAIRIGTASWTEPEFIKAGWYPMGLGAGKRLAWYATHFDLVELNSSFYSLPSSQQCEKWVKDTPRGFLMDIKCHRSLSRHATKPDALPKDLRGQVDLSDRGSVILTPDLEAEIANRLIEALAPLHHAGKLGAILLQMTPSFGPRAAGLTALEPLLRQLKGKSREERRVVLELRHQGWLDERHRESTTGFLQEQGVTFASIDGPPFDGKHFQIMPAFDVVIEPRLTYLRLHGRDPQAYLNGKTVAERFNYDYSDAEIAVVSERAQHLAAESDSVHVVFNNNRLDYAPQAAIRLRQQLRQVTEKRPIRLRQAELL